MRPGWRNVDLPDFDCGNRTHWSQFAEGSAETIYAGCVLPHLPQSQPDQEDPLHVCITEAWRVLKPGGIFVITAPDPRDLTMALAAVHHYRVIHPATFSGYLGTPSGTQGVKAASSPNRYSNMTIEWGTWGPYDHNKKDDKGRILGVSKIAPGFMQIGAWKLGILTHLARRLNLKFMLRGDKIRLVLTK